MKHIREEANRGACRIIDDRSTTRRFLGRTATAAGILAAVILPVGAMAEPASLVQTLTAGVDGFEDLRFVQEDGILVTDDRLHTVDGLMDKIVTFARDPISGRIDVTNRWGYDKGGVAGAGASGRADGAEFLPFSDFAEGSGDRVFVLGAFYSGTDCLSPTPLCFIDQGIATLVLDGADAPRMVGYHATALTGVDLVASPDGRHLYTAGEYVTTFRVDENDYLEEIDRFDENASGTTSANRSDHLDFTPDGRFGFALATSRGESLSITTFSRDVSSGVLTIVADTEIPEGGTNGKLAISPGGTRLYVTHSNLADQPNSGLLSYELDPSNGTLVPLGVESSPNRDPGNGYANPRSLSISSTGRLIASSSRSPDDALHFWSDSGETDGNRYLGRETEGRYGVTAADTGSITASAFSPDGAFLYTASLNDETTALSTWAVHADTRLEIAAPNSARPDATPRSRVTLFNAGPATAHEAIVEITSSSGIVGVSPSDACRLDGGVATCQVDRLTERSEFDMIIASAPSPNGSSVELTARKVSQIQVDLDGTDDTVTRSYAIDRDAPATDSPPPSTSGSDDGTTEPEIADSGATPGSDAASSGGGGSGGGCSIASGKGNAFLPALAFLAFGAVLARGGRRRIRFQTRGSRRIPSSS